MGSDAADTGRGGREGVKWVVVLGHALNGSYHMVPKTASTASFWHPAWSWRELMKRGRRKEEVNAGANSQDGHLY